MQIDNVFYFTLDETIDLPISFFCDIALFLYKDTLFFLFFMNI